MERLLELKNLTKKYYDGPAENKVVDHVDLEVYDGEFMMIMGASGSGKTSLLHLIAGIDDFDEGMIKYQDIDYGRMSRKERTIFRRKNMGIVFQQQCLIPDLTVYENIMLPLMINRRKAQADSMKSTILNLCRQFGLEQHVRKYPSQLSGGQMELYVNGEKKMYEITGIFQTLSNYGNVIRMVTDNLEEFVNADGSHGDYMLVLSDNVDKWEYAKELTEKYDGKYSFIASKSNGENITGILIPVAGIILAVLLIITVLITVNLTFLLVRQEQSLIGLLKAVGMIPGQILKIYVWRNCLSALIGSGLGILLGTFMIPDLLAPQARILGLTEFPFVNSFEGIAMSLLLTSICMFLGTCAVIKIIYNVSVNQLVNE